MCCIVFFFVVFLMIGCNHAGAILRFTCQSCVLHHLVGRQSERFVATFVIQLGRLK